jgi:predicted kinase
MSDERQAVLRLAAWFHDIAKPATTEVRQETYFIRVNPEDGTEDEVVFTPKDEEDRPEGGEELLQRERVGQPGHAPLGASMSYQALIDAGADVETAREVHSLVFWHQRPFFLLNENSAERRAIQYSIDAGRGSWHELLTLCRADNRGRTSINAQETLDGFDLLELALEEMGENMNCDLMNEVWPFETEEARLKFLRSGNKGSAFFMPENPKKGRMILMSGLPGAGKDTLIKEKFAGVNTVSLDDIRGQMDVGWKDNQGQVIQAGFEAARVEMRAGNDFIWNATGLSRQQRQKIIGLARDYDYLVEGVSIDIPLSEAKRRNAQRDRSIPDHVMDKLGRKRDPIICDEVHRLTSVDINGEFTQVFGGASQEPLSEPEL